jgi:hypothetical protein
MVIVVVVVVVAILCAVFGMRRRAVWYTGIKVSAEPAVAILYNINFS